jgi:hypothetical protein
MYGISYHRKSTADINSIVPNLKYNHCRLSDYRGTKTQTDQTAYKNCHQWTPPVSLDLEITKNQGFFSVFLLSIIQRSL